MLVAWNRYWDLNTVRNGSNGASTIVLTAPIWVIVARSKRTCATGHGGPAQVHFVVACFAAI